MEVEKLLSPQKKDWKDVHQSANSASLQVELWGILIFLIYAYLLFYIFDNKHITWITSKRNEGYKYEEKLVYNTCSVISSSRDLKQTCWQTGNMSF